MSTAVAEPDKTAEAPALRHDTLADSVIVLVLLTLIQPAVGFARSVLFCRWLGPEEIGQWDLVQAFLALAAPLAVFGIPGSFGRFVAYYRARGRLKVYLFRATIATALLGLAAVAIVLCLPEFFAQTIFNDRSQTQMLPMIAVTLGTVIALGYVTELLTAMRLFRVMSAVQIVRSVAFLVVGVAFLWGWQVSASGVVAAYAAASLLSVLVGAHFINRAWRQIDEDPHTPPTESMFRRLSFFAGWVWISNALSNLFEVVDRFMLVHFSTGTREEIIRDVGNYHASRVIPLLLLAFAYTLVSMLLPHFSHHWEEGNKALAGRQRDLALKLYGAMQLMAAIAVLIIAPWLFDTFLEGKFADGQALLPWTLIYCIWFSLGAVAAATLWCADEARLSTFGLFVGMVVTVGLNVILLPRYGLMGAVWAAAAGKVAFIALVYLFNGVIRLPMDRGVWIVSATPLACLAGPWIALATLVALAVVAWTTRLILSDEDKRELVAFVRSYWQRITARPAGTA